MMVNAPACIPHSPAPGPGRPRWIDHGAAVAAATLCTAIGLLITPRFDIVNVAMIYLLGVVVVALLCSRAAAVTGAAVSVAAFDFLFVPPQGTFAVGDLQYLLTFAIMLAVALLVSELMRRTSAAMAARAEAGAQAESERLRSALLASISHDLRTPLAVLLGAASTLAERGEQLPAAERVALARSLQTRAEDMAEQVDKVLQMTRLELSPPDLKRDWTSLAELAATVRVRLKERLAQHRLVVDIPDDLPLVRIDAALIEQVLVNLLENAARHTPPDTTVVLAAKVRDAALQITVEDLGPGMPVAAMRNAFAKFTARDQISDQAGSKSGVGLGLAICRAAVTLHGGAIEARARVGGGTLIRFTLPLEAAPPPPDLANDRAP